MRELMGIWQRNPNVFISEHLGCEPWQTQIDIMNAVRDHPRVAVRSCHGPGKTFLAARVMLWFLYSFSPSIVLSTAPTWRQVEKLIWKEVRSAYRQSLVVLGGNLPPKSSELQIWQDEWCALGISTNDPNRFQGFHQENVLVVVDEAAGVAEDIFEAVAGVLTSGHTRLLLLGNPTAVGGKFYRTFRSPSWKTFHISAYDTPNFTGPGITEEDIIDNTWEAKLVGHPQHPGLISPQWVYDNYIDWGLDHPAYQARILGQFPTEGERAVIPLAWVEAAMDRWADFPNAGNVTVGVDVARYGDDKTVISARQGNKVLDLSSFRKLNTMEVVGNTIQTYKTHNATAIKVDEIGLGAGVVDRLAEQGYPVVGINVGSSSDVVDSDGDKKFINLRSELWWAMRERLDPNPHTNPDPVALPPDDQLLADLAGPSYTINSRGQTVVESKDDMKKRLGRSPDRADSVMMTFAPDKRAVVVAPVIVGAGYSRW